MQPDATRLRGYAIVLLAVVATALAGAEISFRAAASHGPLSVSQKFVKRVLSRARPDVVAGDSHIGQYQAYTGYTFLGQQGITPFEMHAALRAYFRNRKPGRVLIESGPQMFARDRQRPWSTLPRSSLERQVLPFSVYLVEPEMIALAEQPFRRLLPRPEPGEAQPSAKSAATAEAEAAMRLYGELLRAAQREQRQFRFSEVPADVRTVLARQRLHGQQPAKALLASRAWREFKSLVEWLVTSGAEVCLIRTPVTVEYEIAMHAGADRRSFIAQQQAVAALARRLHVDYVEPADIGFADLPLDYFNNHDHLNSKGFRTYWPAVERACFGGPRPRGVANSH